MSRILAFLSAAGCGILSGFGVGGGTLLMLVLSFFTKMEQSSLQGLNLLTFLATGGSASVSHWKNGLVEKRILLPLCLSGAISTIGFSFLATAIDHFLLRKAFGLFLIGMGLKELFEGKSVDIKNFFEKKPKK